MSVHHWCSVSEEEHSCWLDSQTSHHDEGAVEVETLSAAFGHHIPRPMLAVLQYGTDEEEQTDTGVQTQEEKLPTVVLPVDPGQVPRSLALLLLHVRRLQPVSSTGGRWERGTDERRGRGVLEGLLNQNLKVDETPCVK